MGPIERADRFSPWRWSGHRRGSGHSWSVHGLSPDVVEAGSPANHEHWGLAGFAVMSALWGSNFFFTSIALDAFGPFLLVFCRMTLAALVLGAMVVVSGGRLPRSPRDWLHLATLGLFNIAAPFVLLGLAQQHVDSATATVLSAIAPLFVFALAFAVGDERFDSGRLAGMLVAFAGTALVALAPGAGSSDGWFWPVVVVATAALYSVGSVYTRHFLSHLDPLVTAWMQITFGALWILPVVPFTDGWHLSGGGLLPVLALIELGVFGTAVAYALYFWFLRTWGSTTTSLNTYLQPAVGLLLGVLILHERPSTTAWLGMAVIALGVGWFGWQSYRHTASADSVELPELVSVGGRRTPE